MQFFNYVGSCSILDRFIFAHVKWSVIYTLAVIHGDGESER